MEEEGVCGAPQGVPSTLLSEGLGEVRAEAPGGAAGRVPICTTCGHPHHPESNCSVCGHGGKSKRCHGRRIAAHLPPYPAQSTQPYFPFTAHAVASRGGADAALLLTAKLVRRIVYCQEFERHPRQEFSAVDDSSRHILLRVGDLPLAAARWRASRMPPSAAEGEVVAFVDRFCVVLDYRGMGLGRHLMEAVRKDVREAEPALRTLVVAAPLAAEPEALSFASSVGLTDTGRTLRLEEMDIRVMFASLGGQRAP